MVPAEKVGVRTPLLSTRFDRSALVEAVATTFTAAVADVSLVPSLAVSVKLPAVPLGVPPGTVILTVTDWDPPPITSTGDAGERMVGFQPSGDPDTESEAFTVPPVGFETV